MPSSSRRKQAKPQHLRCQEDEDQTSTGNPNVTSTHSLGDQSTQEGQHGSVVTGIENGSKITGETDTFSDNSGEDDIIAEKNGDNQTESETNYLNINLTNNIYDNNDSSDAVDYEDRGTPVPIFTPPSPQLANRFCVYCNVVKKSPADLERHLRKHTGDRPFACQGCDKTFKSKRSLQYHAYMNHGIEDADSNIAQRYGILRKRRLEETQMRSDSSPYTQEQMSLTSEMLVSNPINYSMKPSYQSTTVLPQDSASKRMKLDSTLVITSQPQYSSAINPVISTNIDSSSMRPMETGLNIGLGENPDGGGDLARACQVCTKVFPKPSDLKRHMMCHTGEKPFKCEFCGKPFRAKSSMHYHLKAAHGLDIELSPGLEERYLRMKTRAHMNMIQKHQFSGPAPPPGSDAASEMSIYRDIDELEEETRSDDSSEMKGRGFTSGMKDRNSGEDRNSGFEGVVIAAAEPFRRNQISIQNETVLVTRLDGLDMVNGKSASVYKCYLCGKMFNSLSGIQCHLSLHFDKQLVSFECCFCDEIFSFKTQMRNHIRKKHGSHLRRKAIKDSSSILNDREDKSKEFSKALAVKAKESKVKSKKYLTCKYCRKIFMSLISLQKHMKYHFWNRNCFCRMCGKSFTQYTSLQLHITRFHWTVNNNAGVASHNFHQKLNFFKSFPSQSRNGMIKGKIEMKKQIQLQRNEKDVTVVLPQSPSENGDLSDAGTSHNSSDNWPENVGNGQYDNQPKIIVAPKRSLMSFHRENLNGKPQSKSPRKTASDENDYPVNYIKREPSSDVNDYPVNYIKREPSNQDTNNNESFHEARSRLSPEYQPNVSSPDSLVPSPYSMNATNHLLLAKALAAQNVSHLTQNTMNTSTPYFPPTTLPPSLAAITHMMPLPSMSMPEPNGPQTSKSPSPASLSSSKSDQSPEDREKDKEMLVGFPRVNWNQKGFADKLWSFNMFTPDGALSTDGRKVTSLSRTHSRLPIVHSPINRESMCKATTTPDGRTVYKCPFCSKDFVSYSDINRHMDFHEDIRPYKCQYCDYYARTNSQLKVHMMRHQGIREFCCKLCNYKGVTQSDLNRHMKSQIHMLKSRNACTHCGEGFVTSKNLEKHLDGNCIVKMQKMNGDLNIQVQESIA